MCQTHFHFTECTLGGRSKDDDLCTWQQTLTWTCSMTPFSFSTVMKAGLSLSLSVMLMLGISSRSSSLIRSSSASGLMSLTPWQSEITNWWRQGALKGGRNYFCHWKVMELLFYVTMELTEEKMAAEWIFHFLCLLLLKHAQYFALIIVNLKCLILAKASFSLLLILLGWSVHLASQLSIFTMNSISIDCINLTSGI